MRQAISEADVRQFVQAFNAEGASALERQLAPEYWAYEPGAGERPANEAIAAEAAVILAAMSDVRLDVSELSLLDGGQVGGRFALSGTHSGVFWGAPASGKHVTLAGGFRARAAGDRLVITLEDVAMPQIAGILREMALVNPADQMDRAPVYPATLPDLVLKLAFTGRAGFPACSHLETAAVFDPSTRVCAACVATGTFWPALRMCLVCGFVGCCDTSRNKHMKAHVEATGHQVYRSLRHDEQWIWCVADGAFYEGPTLDRLRAAAAGRA